MVGRKNGTEKAFKLQASGAVRTQRSALSPRLTDVSPGESGGASFEFAVRPRTFPSDPLAC